RRMDPTTQMGLVAAREAWTDAGLSSDNIEPERLAVAFGTGIGGVWTLLDSWDNLRERGPRRVLPMTVPKLMPIGAGAAISMGLSAGGGAVSTGYACAAGRAAVHNARPLIEPAQADVGVAGGAAAAIHPLPIPGFPGMQALSNRNDGPQAASRP